MTNEESFNSVQNWIKDIVQSNGNINKQYELILVANKIDETEKRIVGKNKGKEAACKYNIKYFEISCFKKINIYELLYEITLMAYKKIEQINKKKEANKPNKSINLDIKTNNKKKGQCC